MTQATASPQPPRLPAQAKRNFLAEASRKSRKRPGAMIVYGPPGIGKTEFAAQVPGCGFLCDDKEDGINTLKEANRGVRQDILVMPLASSWADTLAMLAELRHEKHDLKALCLDAIGGFERLCHETVCRREYNGQWGKEGFTSYQAGYEASLGDWRQFLIALDALRDERGMSIVLIGHSKVAPFKNPEGPDYDKYQPDIHHKTWSVTAKWADLVLFLNYDVATAKEGGKVKGKGGRRRIMHTEECAAFTAKNRFGLPEEIDMGSSGAEAWTNLTTAIKAAKEAGSG